MGRRQITGFVLFLFLLIPACLIQRDDFFISTSKDYKVLQIASSEVSFLKENVYIYDGTLYLASEYLVKSASGNGMATERKGLYLHKSIDGIPVADLIDLESYEAIKPLLLYKDKERVYFFQLEGGCHLCAATLDLNPKTLKMLDPAFEYLTDGQTTYCLRNGEKIATTSKLSIVKFGNSSFAVDANFIYSMCEPIDPEEFVANFDILSTSERRDFVKRFFPKQAQD